VIVQRPESQRIAATDFFQVGTSHRFWKLSATADLFLIDRSAEQVYLAFRLWRLVEPASG
jgi:hypothetical protein